MEFTVAGGCIANLFIAHVFLRFGDSGGWLLTGLWISATTMFYILETNLLLVAEIRVWSRVSKTRALAGSQCINYLLCTWDSCLEPVKSRRAIVITHFIYWLNIGNPSLISIAHIWQEINAILGDRLSTADEEAVLAEFEELEMKVLFPYILNYTSLSYSISLVYDSWMFILSDGAWSHARTTLVQSRVWRSRSRKS